MHMADATVFGFDVDEIDRTSQGIAVRLDKKGLRADEVVGSVETLLVPDIIILSIGRVTLKEQPVTPNRMETDISVK
jgi:hypothetical protein